MIPLNKGPRPIAANGKPKAVRHYDLWRLDLIDRPGKFCSFCNMPVSFNINVEHVIPKNPNLGPNAGDPLAWENMLLSCGPCNGAKSDKLHNITTHIMPENGNPLLYFDYEIDSESNDTMMYPVVKASLSDDDKIKARATIELLNLLRKDKTGNVKDLRSRIRREKYKAYLKSRSLFFNVSEEIRYSDSNLHDFAVILSELGFFALAFKVFKDEKPVIKALVKELKELRGLNQDCFDDEGQPIAWPRV